MKKNASFPSFKTTLIPVFINCLVLFLCIQTAVFSATVSAVSSGNWNSAATWDLRVPLAGDDVIIQGFTITLNTNQSCASVSLNSGSAVTLLQVNGNALSVAGNFTITQSNGSSDIRVRIDNDAVLNVGNSFVLNQSAGDDVELYLNNTSGEAAQLNIANNFTVNKSGGDDLRIRIYGESSEITVANNCTLNHNQGSNDRLDLDMNDGSFTIANNLSITIGSNAGRIFLDMDGGELSASTMNVANNCSNTSGDILFYLDGDASVSLNNDFNVNIAGGDDLRIFLNQSSGTSAQFNITNNFNVTKTSNAGDDIDIYVDDASSSFFVGGNFTNNFAGSNDRFFMNLDGGNFTVNGNTTHNISLSAGNLQMDLDGGNFTTNTFTANYSGNRDILLYVDNGSEFVANADFIVNHSGGDDFLLYLNQTVGTSAKFDVAGNVIYSKLSNAGDDFRIIVDDAASVFNVGANFISTFNGSGDLLLINMDAGTFSVGLDMVMNMGANTGYLYYDIDGGQGSIRDLTVNYNGANDFYFRLDNSASFSLRDFSTNFNSGDDFDLRLNNNAGTNAQLNMSGDFSLTHQGAGDDSYFFLNQSAAVTIAGSLTIDNNASGGDFIEIQLASASNTLNVIGDLTMNLNSGAASSNDDNLIDMNNGTLIVGGDALFFSSGGDQTNIRLDNNSAMRVAGDLSIDNAGGVSSFIFLNSSSGTGAVLSVDGNLNINQTGTSSSELELNQNAVASILGNITFNAVGSGFTRIDMDNNAQLNLGGNFLRPNGFGLLDAQVNQTVVNFNGTSSAQTWVTDENENFRYRHVLFNNTSPNGVALGTDITTTAISGNVSTETGLALTGGFSTAMNSGRTFLVADGATWETTTTNSTGGISTGGFQDIGANSIIHFSGANQTVPVLISNSGGQLQDYGVLRISGTGTKTLAGNEAVVTNLEMMASIFDVNTQTLNGGGAITATGGDLQLAKLATILPELTGNYNMTGGTTTFNGVGDQLIKSATFFNVLAAGSGIKSPAGSMDVNGTLSITSELDVTAGNIAINLAGDWNNTGVFTARNGLLNLDGSSLQSINGNTDFFDVSLNNSEGAIISTGNTNLIGTLTLTSGNFNANGRFTLISDISGTARIAEITGGSISGAINMQRYIIAGATNWRFISSPINGVTLADFNDDFETSGYPGSLFPEWPTANNPWASIYYYDETVAGDQDNGFVAATSSTNTIGQGEGLWVWSGDTITGTQPFTIDMVGPSNFGNINLPISYTNHGNSADDGWNMVGNPYPSAIDWDSPNISKNNVNNAIYIWNPQNQQFASYVSGFGTNGGSSVIASNQAFWLQANASNPSVQVTEASKTAANATFFKQSSIQPLRITTQNSAGSDELIINFNDNASAGFDPLYDAEKIPSSNTNLPRTSSVINGKNYSINQLNTQEINIPIQIITGVSGVHNISIENANDFSNNAACLILEDVFNNITYDLSSESSFSTFIYDTTQTPQFLLHIGAPVEIITEPITCFGDSNAQILYSKMTANTFDISWMDANNVVIASNNNVAMADSIDGLGAGTYFVQTADLFCGNTLDTIYITQPNQISAYFSSSQDTAYLANGANISFNNWSSNASYYEWDFGDSNTSTVTSPVHQYSQAGIYNVTLNAYQDTDCFETFTKIITVIETITAVSKETSTNQTKIWSANNQLLINGQELNSVSVKSIIGQTLFSSNNVSDYYTFDLNGIASQTLIVTTTRNQEMNTVKIIYLKE